MLSCSIWFSEPSLGMSGGLDSRSVGRVYSADGAVARHHPHCTHDPRSGSQDKPSFQKLGVENHMLQLNI